MKIAIDFDDVMVDTMQEFLGEWNKGRPGWATGYMTRNMINNWNLPQLLNVSLKVVQDIFLNKINYAKIDWLDGAVAGVKKLKADGHLVFILTANPRYDDIRDALNGVGLQDIALHAGAGHKAGWCRDTNVDILIEDRPAYLKGAVTVGVHAIRFSQPWNKMLEDWGVGTSDTKKLEHNASDWDEVVQVVSDISAARLLDAISNLTSGRVKVLGKVDMGEGNNISIGGNVVGSTVVTNARGAKQSKIDGRFDLLPALAVKEIAVVLAEGEEKYGKNNWKGLSIDEINNHVYNHLLDYQQEANTEDLSHAATRILMALQLHLERLDKQGPLGA